MIKIDKKLIKKICRRGIPATPVLNGYCGDYEYGMENSVIYEPVFNYGWPNSSSPRIIKPSLLLISFICCIYQILNKYSF